MEKYKLYERVGILEKIAKNYRYLGHGNYSNEDFYNGYIQALNDIKDEISTGD